MMTALQVRHSARQSLRLLRYQKYIYTSSEVAEPVNATELDLDPYSVVYANHHLLVVNKPAGWHSVPTADPSSPKCLLGALRRDRRGGGSSQTFLLPLHRVDQPCTGLVMLAKNRKAARRIQREWTHRRVEKEYLCVVEVQKGCLLTSSSWSSAHSNTDTNQSWHELHGVFHPPPLVSSSPSKRPHRQRTVTITPVFEENTTKDTSRSDARPCSLRYRIVLPTLTKTDEISTTTMSKTTTTKKDPRYALLRVRTSTGFRHQIRAMLATLLRCPVAGDRRYGDGALALPDRSVALHARSLFLPETLQLGGMEDVSLSPLSPSSSLSEDDDKDDFKRKYDCQTPSFVAPIPSSWRIYFGLSEDDVL